MSEAKPTPGVWKAKGRDVFIGRLRVVHAANAASQKPMNMRDEVEQAQENARFIADAGNTYNTTGLTPSQLVERVKELEEALRNFTDGCSLSVDAGAIARAALSKARPNTAEGEAQIDSQPAPVDWPRPGEREAVAADIAVEHEIRRLRAIEQTALATEPVKQCAGIPRPGCDYMAECGSVCRKCGEVHSAHLLMFDAPHPRWPSYEVAVSDPVFQVARSIMGTENMGQDRQLVAAINHVLAAAPTPAAAKEPSP